MKRHNYTILVEMLIVFMGVEWWKAQSFIDIKTKWHGQMMENKMANGIKLLSMGWRSIDRLKISIL
jgi:hypothetical protein